MPSYYKENSAKICKLCIKTQGCHEIETIDVDEFEGNRTMFNASS